MGDAIDVHVARAYPPAPGSIYAAWDRGDFTHVEWADPEIEFVTFAPLAGTSISVSAMGKRWRDFLSAWTEFRTEVDEFRELDEERVLGANMPWRP